MVSFYRSHAMVNFYLEVDGVRLAMKLNRLQAHRQAAALRNLQHEKVMIVSDDGQVVGHWVRSKNVKQNHWSRKGNRVRSRIKRGQDE